MKRLCIFLIVLFLFLSIFVSAGIVMFTLKGYTFNPVTPTGSMYPTIKTRDIVIINWNTYQFIDRNLTGEIIVFSDENICHRCIIDEGEWLTTRGDALNSTEHLTRDEVSGIFIQVSNEQFVEMLRYGWIG